MTAVLKISNMEINKEKSFTLLDYCAMVLSVTVLCINMVALISLTSLTDGAAPPTDEIDQKERQLLKLQDSRLLILNTANIFLLVCMWILYRDRHRYWPKSTWLVTCAFALLVIGLCCQ